MKMQRTPTSLGWTSPCPLGNIVKEHGGESKRMEETEQGKAKNETRKERKALKLPTQQKILLYIW